MKAIQRGIMSESLSAGAFARQSRLSAKALRLYAANGILVPDRVDADTGYRHYSRDQLQDARLVRLLRRSGVPLAVVAEILDAPREQRSAVVERYAEQSEAELRRRLQLLAHLSRTFSGGKDSYPMSNIRTRNVPDQTVLTEQAYVSATELSDWIARTGLRQLEIAASVGGQIGPSMVIYHGDVSEDSDGPVESCIPIDPEKGDASHVPTRVEPAHTEAFIRVTRAQVRYPDMLAAYDALNAWIDASDVTVSGPPRELYFADPSTGPEDEPVADVAIPIAS
ncbi:MAG TPA: MerR family transcriptional regulator [Leifsonia sp.]|nr:MerR family transcriptional regulator [Leifsonia sp.]